MFYSLLIFIVGIVGFLSFLVRTTGYIRRNIILYCALLPVVERSLIPVIKFVTVRFYMKGAENRWYFQNSSGIMSPSTALFVTQFRTLSVNCFIFLLLFGTYFGVDLQVH